MKRSPPPRRRKGLRRLIGPKRTRLRRSQPKRDWSEALAKVRAEGECRVCGQSAQVAKLDAAHVLERALDKRSGYVVLPSRIVPLCAARRIPGYGDIRGCHSRYDVHELDLWPYLTPEEQARAIVDAGSPALALKRCAPVAYRREVAA